MSLPESSIRSGKTSRANAAATPAETHHLICIDLLRLKLHKLQQRLRNRGEVDTFCNMVKLALPKSPTNRFPNLCRKARIAGKAYTDQEVVGIAEAHRPLGILAMVKVRLQEIHIIRNSLLRFTWFEYYKHSHYMRFSLLDPWARMRLRSILRKRGGGEGRGRGRDHQLWPNAFFAKRGLLSLLAAHTLACQSSRR
jgi:hypothetical protein